MADITGAEQPAQATKRPLPAEHHDENDSDGNENTNPPPQNTKRRKYRLTKLAKKYGEGIDLVRILWLSLLRSNGNL